MKITDCSALCLLQMEALDESVCEYAPHSNEWLATGYEVPKNAQANKTAIKRQIVALRQSLLKLERFL